MIFVTSILISFLKTPNKRILFITQWPFEDALIQTYTLPYVRIIQNITSWYPYVVVADRTINKIAIKKRGSVITIVLPYLKQYLFLRWVLNIIILWRIVKQKKVGVIHPVCTPAGAVGTILKMANRKVVLNIDSFEPHAESMVENKTWKRAGLKFRLLFYFEGLETRIADYLIFAAPGMQDYIREKYGTIINKYSVKPACVNIEAFSDKFIGSKELVDKYNLADKIVCVYAGKFGGIYLEDEIFQFVKACESFWGKDRFCFLLLSNAKDTYMKKKMDEYHIEASSIIKLFVRHTEIPYYMGLANFAISPYKSVPSKRYCTPIKDGEYWAMGLPVVITPNISVDSEIVKENAGGAILESFDEAGYQKAIEQINNIIKGKTRAEIYCQIRPLAEKHRNFSIAKDIYGKLYGKGL